MHKKTQERVLIELDKIAGSAKTIRKLTSKERDEIASEIINEKLS